MEKAARHVLLVYDSREQPDGAILRKRRCKVCGVRFMTREAFWRLITTPKEMNGSLQK